jgi:hypothetical protein
MQMLRGVPVRQLTRRRQERLRPKICVAQQAGQAMYRQKHWQACPIQGRMQWPCGAVLLLALCQPPEIDPVLTACMVGFQS